MQLIRQLLLSVLCGLVMGIFACKNHKNIVIPTANQWVKSPLRNKLVLELDQSINKVWATVGNPRKINLYSNNFENTEAKLNAQGDITEYTSFFKNDNGLDDEASFFKIRSQIKWYEPNVGWAALDDEPNDFDLRQSLTLICLKQNHNKTTLTWTQYFESPDYEIHQAGFKQTLDEISNDLIKEFGGRIIENNIIPNPITENAD